MYPTHPRLLLFPELLLALVLCILPNIFTSSAIAQSPPKTTPCPSPEVPTTTPSPVDVEAILGALGRIRTDGGLPVFTVDESLRREVRDTFSGGRIKTKMGQFFTTLYIIQNHSSLPSGKMHVMRGEALLEAMLLSGVFPDDTFPRTISHIEFRRSSQAPLYQVTFNAPEVRLPLNRGQGFSTLQHGMCQTAKAMIFRSPFRFNMQLQPNSNLRVYKFQNVDIEGNMGTRGVIDLDLNFVSLISVEFIHESHLGYVKARVADREFEMNNHPWILKVITSFFSDTTRQAIDW